MRYIRRTHKSFKLTPLWQAAREREFRALTYTERKLAEEFGVDPHIARVLAAQAYGPSRR